MTTALSKAAIDALSNVRCEGNTAVIVEQLDRKLYLEVNGALATLGGKWNKGRKAHLFPGDPREAIERIVVDGEFTNIEKDLEFFETPRPLAESLVRAADIDPGMRVLEPSAGKGAILRALLGFGTGKDQVLAVEKNTAFVEGLRAEGWFVMATDFLTVEPATLFDRVIMNSPFSKGQDIAHVSHAFNHLKPGGRLVAVMASGVTFRTTDKAKAFRALVARCGEIKNLPAGSFKSSGTMVNTVMVTLNKENVR